MGESVDYLNVEQNGDMRREDMRYLTDVRLSEHVRHSHSSVFQLAKNSTISR